MVRFGVAGYPPAFGKTPYRKDRLKILDWLSSLGLNALELQMTYGPRTKIEVCREYRNIAKDFGISISVHASYFIVFTSNDPVKLERSRDTLKRTFDLCSALGADVVVLHPGPLYSEDGPPVLCRFIDNLGAFMEGIGQTEIGLFVETAGKVGQLGSVKEILQVCDIIPGVYPCIDFGHVHARTLGTLESETAVSDLFAQLETHCRQRPSHRIHFHYTPIHFGARGEISHKAINDTYPSMAQMALPSIDHNPLRSNDGFFHPRVEPVAKGLKRLGVECTVISETHDSQEEGALALKDAFLNSPQ
jgi:deoxyribonuclease-4